MATALTPERFREVFRRFATGVAVVTSTGIRGAGGMTANALCSLSLDPLLALVCLLTTKQEELAGVFASKLPESEKLDGVGHRLQDGVPIIDGVHAWATCELRDLIPGGDHTIAIGEVISIGLGGGVPPVWYGGRYHALPRD